MTSLTLAVDGMTCAACVRRVERVLSAVEGVESASVNLVTGNARLSVVASEGLEGRLTAALEDAGYAGHPVRPADEQRASAPAARRGAASGREVLIAALFAVPLFVGSMLPMLFGADHEDCATGSTSFLGIGSPHGGWTMWAMGWGGLVLALPVQLYSARGFYRRALTEVRHLSLGMNTLVALGSTAAFAYSVVALAAPSLFPVGAAKTYFEASSR